MFVKVSPSANSGFRLPTNLPNDTLIPFAPSIRFYFSSVLKA